MIENALIVWRCLSRKISPRLPVASGVLFGLLIGLRGGAEPLPISNCLDANVERARLSAIGAYRRLKLEHLRPRAWTLNSYFCRRRSGLTQEDAAFELDGDGLPMRRHKDGSYYHPISVGRAAINAAITYMNTREPSMLVWTRRTADKLLDLMDTDGAFRYGRSHELYYYGRLPVGWTSAMAQGTVLSAFARAYLVTCDERYVRAGNLTLAYLLTPIEEGGTTTTLGHLHPSLSMYVWYEEYPIPGKPGYTLNGYMYTLLGLHDWAEATGSLEAQRAFEEGVQTLKIVLPLFDFKGVSSYDLAWMTYGKNVQFTPRYHSVHLSQLSALYAITREPVFEAYRRRWYESVGGPVRPCGRDGETDIE